MELKTPMRRSLVIAAAALVTALLVSSPGLADGDLGGRHCRLAGSWVTTNPDTGGVFLDTLSPMDPAENLLTYSSEWINQDPSFGGFFPATSVSIIRGEMIRTDRDSGHISILAYGLAEVFPGGPRVIVYSAVINGPFEIIDCDTIAYPAGTVSIYLADQDPLGGDPPFACIPYTALEARRVRVAPQCEVLPGP